MDGVMQEPGEDAGSLIRVLLVITAAWLIITFIFTMIFGVFRGEVTGGILIYTLVACILVGTIFPVYPLRHAFITGAVNMFQIGFRPVRRTVLMVALTLIMGYVVMILTIPAGQSRVSFLDTILLLLPTAIASVMICWVVMGTHIQALVRNRGTLFSIIAGVVVTALMFTVSSCAYLAPVNPGLIASSLGIGIIAALFFFSVRDVYATIIVVTLCNSLTIQNTAGIVEPDMPLVYLSVVLAIAALTIIHAYFMQNFRTIVVPVSLREDG